MTEGIRVGVDVGGTFTKAVAVTASSDELMARAVTPTTHRDEDGVSVGVAKVLTELLAQLGDRRPEVELVAYSTTIAMNALLEGDVGKVGIIGIGSGKDARLARKRSAVGDIQLAQGKRLHTKHSFIDAARLTEEVVVGTLEGIKRDGCDSIAVSGAFSVDDAAGEKFISEIARERGLPTCAGHELTGTYGLETRTVSAVINASILPLVERTASIVESSLQEAGIDVPLLVLKGDGGAMTLQAFRETPSFTIGSGPAAGVAAALHELGLSDGLVVECGGTSSNVSIVKRGRAALRTLRVMERPTAIRSVDSWVVGAAGGSMARLRRRKFTDTGPRSAHVANLPYACFAAAGDLRGAEIELIAPREGDPESYVVLRAGERRWALTATCAGTALGLGSPTEEASESAGLAFDIVAAALRTTPEKAARELLDGAVAKIARATKEAASAHDFGPEVPVIALGGSGTILAPEVARVLDRPIVTPDNPEVLSSIGAALSLIRAEVVRTAVGGEERSQITREAELACLAAGAAPQTIRVETFYEHDANLIRGVATGAVALESGAVNRRQVSDEECLAAAARALEVPSGDLDLIARNDFYRVYTSNGKGACAIVDGTGAVPFAENAKSVFKGEGNALINELQPAVESQSVNLGLAEIAPRVVIVRGPNIIDLSDARSATEILGAVRDLLSGYEGESVGIVWS